MRRLARHGDQPVLLGVGAAEDALGGNLLDRSPRSRTRLATAASRRAATPLGSGPSPRTGVPRKRGGTAGALATIPESAHDRSSQGGRSPEAGPASMARSSLKSAIEVAGPSVAKSIQSNGSPPMIPHVGFKPKRPQNEAGCESSPRRRQQWQKGPSRQPWRGGAAAGSARRPFEGPWIARRSEQAIRGERLETELGHVGLSDGDRPSRSQARDVQASRLAGSASAKSNDPCVVRRPTTSCESFARNAILGQRATPLAAARTLVHGSRLRQRGISVAQLDHGVQIIIETSDAFVGLLDKRLRRRVSGRDHRSKLSQRRPCGHRSLLPAVIYRCRGARWQTMTREEAPTR